jgi:hypothetical protein
MKEDYITVTPPPVEVIVEPATSSIEIGETEEYSIVLSTLQSGLGSFDIDINLTQPGIARIIGVEVIENGTHSPVPAQSVNCWAMTHIPDGSENVVIVTVTIEGLAEGTTGLTVSSAAFYPEYEPVVTAAEIVVGGDPPMSPWKGIFRESNGLWALDTAGDHEVDTYFVLGMEGDQPVSGDGWKGIFRESNGLWALDTTGDNEVDTYFVLGMEGDQPVSGDGWKGIFRESNGLWALDTTGDNEVDTYFVLGMEGDQPVAGNGWKGIFRESNGLWALDTTGDHEVDTYFVLGMEGDQPVAGMNV